MLKDLTASFATAGILTVGISKNLKRETLLGAFPLTYSATSTVRGKVRRHIEVVDFFEMGGVNRGRPVECTPKLRQR